MYYPGLPASYRAHDLAQPALNGGSLSPPQPSISKREEAREHTRPRASTPQLSEGAKTSP